jgi:hypothetical protein
LVVPSQVQTTWHQFAAVTPAPDLIAYQGDEMNVESFLV